MNTLRTLEVSLGTRSYPIWIGDGLLDEIANAPIVIAQRQPVDPLAAKSSVGHPRHYVGL